MPKYSTAFGMDVHLRSTTVCALDADTGEAVARRFPGNPWGEIAGWMDGFVSATVKTTNFAIAL